MEDKEIVLRRAKNAVISRDFNLAIRLYKSLLQDDVKNLEYLSTLGNLYMKNNDDEKALPYFQQILTFYPDDFEAMNSMGGIFRRMGKYQESIDILQKALDTKVNPAQVNYNLGFTYKLMEDYPDAIECFENVIAVNPTDVLAYNHLGTIYAAQDNHEKAVFEYKRGLQVDPNHPILQFNLAKSLEAVHDDTSAIQAYESALRAKPGWQEAVIAYSKLLLNHRKTKLAGELVQNAIGLHPQDAELYVQMGKILMRQSNFEKAASSFEIANRLSPENPGILKNLAESLEKLGKHERAVLTIKKAEKILPDDEKIRKTAAAIYLSAENYSEAAALIRQIGAARKNDCEAFDLAGQYSILIGKTDSAEKFALKIKAADSGYENYLYSFANRFFQKGEFSAAKEKIKAFIDENMKNVPAWILLGQIDEKLGNLSDALDDFSTAVAFDPNNFLAGKLAKEIEGRLGSEKEVSEGKESQDSAVSGAEEISLDEFGFGDETPAAEESSKVAAEIPDEKNPSDSTDGLKEEDKTDVLALDDESALFEDNDNREEDVVDTVEDDIGADEKSAEEINPDELCEKSETPDEKVSLDEILDEPEDVPDAEGTQSSGNVVNVHASEKDGGENLSEDENASENEISSEPAEKTDSEKTADSDSHETVKSYSDTAEKEEKTENSAEPEQSNSGRESEKPNSEQAAEPAVEPAEEKPEETNDSKAKNAYENLVDKVSDVLPKLSTFIENSEEVAKFQKEIELFKRLRQFGDALPFEQRAKFLAGRVRLLLDYIIARLSGRPGLLKSAAEIREKENLPVDSMESAINGANRSDIVNVLKDMESLTYYLEDKNLSKALIVAAEEVVDKLS